MGILNTYKPKGWTPLQAVSAIKEKFAELKDASITYAGRLDPLAEGVLLLLFGESISEKEKYLGLDKEYIARILFGFGTDTFDILGLITKYSIKKLTKEEIKEALKTFKGKISLALPAYSSPPVQGKPLFQWARENRLDEIEIPKREMEIQNISFTQLTEKNWSEITEEIQNSIQLVQGDFRQEKITEKWKETYSPSIVQILEIQISCSSGTYIRSLVNELGKALGTSATLLSLKRTRVGEHTSTDSIILTP